MSGTPKAPVLSSGCPFCGLAAIVAHETQEGCIAALHEEIGRMRAVLSTLTPAGVPGPIRPEDDAAHPSVVRLALSKPEIR
jgi:hypothetical protein